MFSNLITMMIIKIIIIKNYEWDYLTSLGPDVQ